MKECPECGKCLDDDHLECPHDGSALKLLLEGPRLIDGKYILERCLGSGAMGSVFLVRHQELDKTFAMKLILHSGLSDPAYLARFRIEAKALGRLQHPNIVQVTDYGVDPRNGGLPYLVMEYLEGTTLFHYLKKKGFLHLEEAFPILECIASAIDYAHGSGILHRDLKSRNIFLVRDFSGQQKVKVLDFGLARIAGEELIKEERKIPRKSKPNVSKDRQKKEEVEETKTLAIDKKNDSFPRELETLLSAEHQRGEIERLTRAGSIMGTPGYIAPELLRGVEATTASDIYSFGVLSYEVLVGERPFKDASVETMFQHIEESPPLPSVEQPTVPKELDKAIRAPLHKEPNLRPEKAMDVILLLKRAYAEYKYQKWRILELPKRIRLAGLLTLFFILFFLLLQELPVFQNIENFMVDIRFQLLPSHPPDNRILLASIDEATLQADPALLVEKADEMGESLQRVMDAGARGIGIDFLLPERWNQSESFVKFILKNQRNLVLASYFTKDGKVIGWEIISGLIMAALGSTERAEALFGFLNLQPDPDGRIRQAQVGLTNKEGKWMHSLAAKSFQILTGSKLSTEQVQRPLWIDYSVDWSKFQRISWKDLSSLLNQRPDLFQDRLVLVGGEYEGSQDFHRIPHRPGMSDDEISGMIINALILNTLLQDNPVRSVGGSSVSILMAVILIVFLTAFLIRPRVLPIFLILLILLAGYVLNAYFQFIWNGQLIPVGMPLITLALAMVLVLWARRKLSFIEKPSREVNIK